LEVEVEMKITFQELNKKPRGCLFLFLCLTSSSSFSLQVRVPDAVHTTGSGDTHVSPKYLKTNKQKPPTLNNKTKAKQNQPNPQTQNRPVL